MAFIADLEQNLSHMKSILSSRKELTFSDQTELTRIMDDFGRFYSEARQLSDSFIASKRDTKSQLISISKTNYLVRIIVVYILLFAFDYE